jgi:hypothetical protein
MLTGLPAPVQRWLQYSGIIGKAAAVTVRLRQKGSMRLKPDQKEWIPCTAEQYFTTAEPSFIWQLSMRLMPGMPVSGRDKFEGGRGSMDIRLWSLLPLARASGQKVDEGALQRYLAELCWFPSAAISPHITWEAINDTTAKATMTYGGTTGSVCYHFNEKGEVTACRASRYKDAGPEAVREQWGGTVIAYGALAGIRIPVAMEVTWFLKSGPFTWYRVEITDLAFNQPGIYPTGH